MAAGENKSTSSRAAVHIDGCRDTKTVTGPQPATGQGLGYSEPGAQDTITVY